jgi:hypothetical protein
MTPHLKTDGNGTRPVATLWRLTWKGDLLSCSVYRDGEGLELRLESPAAVILAEPFELQPRALARTQSLRESLKRRGWEELAN